MSSQSGWLKYVDSMIQYSSGGMTCGCIIGRDGSLWTPPGAKVVNINAVEAQNIARCYNNKNFDSMYAEGVRVNGKKYAIIRYDRNARLVNAAQTGIGGVVLQATKRAVLIGLCSDTKMLGSVNCSLGKVAGHLGKNGY